MEKQRQYFVDAKQRNPRSSVMMLVIVFFSHLIFLCLDFFLQARYYLTAIRGVTLNVADFVNFVMMIQFCNFVRCIRDTLTELNTIISVNRDGNTVGYSAKRGFKSRQQFGQRSASRSAVHIDMIQENSPFRRDINHPTPGETLSVRHIIFCRRVYNDVYDAHVLVNSIYGIPLLLGFVVNVTFSIINVYHILMDPVTISFLMASRLKRIETLIFRVFWFFMCTAVAFYVTVSSHMVTVESNKLNDEIQKLLLLHPLHKDSVKQLKLFSDQISKNCIKFSAFCFFTIDMSLFCVYVATTIAYTIVLVQFK